MSAQTVSPKPGSRRSGVFSDQSARVGIAVLIVALLILIALIAFITFLPAQTITRTVAGQASEQQKLRAESFARQIESYFISLANELIGLAGSPAIQSLAQASRVEALKLLEDTGTRSEGRISAIVRIGEDASPVYAWPDAYQKKVAARQPLPWTVDKAWIDNVIRGRGVQLTRRSLSGDVAYLLVSPVFVGNNIQEVLAFEIPLTRHLQTIFSDLDLGETGQIWVLDQFSSELYHHRADPPFRGGTAQLLSITETTLLPGYPTADRESVIVPVYTAFTQARDRGGSLVVIVSHTEAEAQRISAGTVQSLFLFGGGIVGFIVLFGLLIGLFLLRETNRRRKEEQRRSTAHTLLEISRALNSSLSLESVLERILAELNGILPHDSASIQLLNEDARTITTVAETGEDSPPGEGHVSSLGDRRGTREVLAIGKPVVINDCVNDPRWTNLPDSQIRSWMGVPLRVRDSSVGVLNINSYEANHFLTEEVEVAESFANQAGVAIQNARAHEFEIRAYEQELETARAIQNSLLPQETPSMPSLEVAARSVPARHVSGDYYQYFILPDGKLGLAVGDVSGKGIPAALLMAVIMTALRDEALRTSSPAGLLSELNNRLLPRMQQNKMNSALLVSVFDPETRSVEMANGGMVQPFMRNGGGWDFVPVRGYPLGSAERTAYKPYTVPLTPDSVIVFATDGVVESQNRKKELFGFERLEALLGALPKAASADEVADAVLSAVRQHLQGQEPQDDITVVVLKSL